MSDNQETSRKTDTEDAGSVPGLVRWRFGINRGIAEWSLVLPNGRSVASVFDNGIWFTWDDEGVGGENSVEHSVDAAKAEALLSALNQGFFSANDQV